MDEAKNNYPLHDELILPAEIPDDLAIAMAAIVDGIDPAVEMGVDILRRRVAEAKGKAGADSCHDALSVVSWVDYFVMNALIVEWDGYMEGWEDHEDEIASLLKEAESLLLDALPVDPDDMLAHKTVWSDKTAINLLQRLNSYLAIAAGYAGDSVEFHKRLSRAMAYTISNVEFLLSRWDRSELLKMERTKDEEFDPSQRYWTEPMSIIEYAATAIGRSREVRWAYERRYIPWLEKQGPDLFGTRARLLLDAEMRLEGLLGASIEDFQPRYPLDVSATSEIRRLVAENPDLPVVVFSGPEETKGTYCNVDRAKVVELLNINTYHYNVASVETSREDFLERVKGHIRDFGSEEGFDESWSDERILEAARKEAARFDDFWIPAIAIYASYKDL